MLWRFLASGMVLLTVLFLVNNYLIFWRQWPGIANLLGYYGLITTNVDLAPELLIYGWIQMAIAVASTVLLGIYIWLSQTRSLMDDANRLSRLAAFIVRAAFWSVLLVGFADMVISFLRVEGFLQNWVGEELNKELGRPRFRGAYVHYPLIALSVVLAFFSRSLGFTWLAFLVVVAEFQIVISRFVFSYEQAFMGDLVRFWYAALFLFASAYALVHEGHVRVDVFYAHFSAKGKAWANTLGSLLLGLPLCWTILIQGMWGKENSINSPLLSYEISQSGYGMYIKYLMAGFLVIFAASMIIQFSSYVLSNVSVLRGEAAAPDEPALDHVSA